MKKQLSITILFLIISLSVSSKTVNSLRDLQEREGKYYLPNSQTLFTGKLVEYYFRGGGLYLKSNVGNIHLKHSSSRPLIKSRETTFLNGLMDGESSRWHSNGQIQEKCHYKNGNLLSLKSFDSSGSLKKEIDADGTGWQKRTEWYSNGKRASEILCFEKVTSHEIKQTLMHSAKSWWLDGTLCSCTNLTRWDGVVVKYNVLHPLLKPKENFEGTFKTYTSYKQGIRDGKYREWKFYSTDEGYRDWENLISHECEYTKDAINGMYVQYEVRGVFSKENFIGKPIRWGIYNNGNEPKFWTALSKEFMNPRIGLEPIRAIGIRSGRSPSRKELTTKLQNGKFLGLGFPNFFNKGSPRIFIKTEEPLNISEISSPPVELKIKD